MPERIPGEEFAPRVVFGYTCERGGFYRTPPEGILTAPATVQLDVRDPDDRRTIWRLVALEHGASEEVAEKAVMHFDGMCWNLLGIGPPFHGDGYVPKIRLIFGPIWGQMDAAHATAALCQKTLAPKGAS